MGSARRWHCDDHWKGKKDKQPKPVREPKVKVVKPVKVKAVKVVKAKQMPPTWDRPLPEKYKATVAETVVVPDGITVTKVTLQNWGRWES